MGKTKNRPERRHKRGRPSGRLIDTGTLRYEGSLSGFKERYLRGETTHTIHVWWARRPHASMRALVFASLYKKADNKGRDLMTKLTFAKNGNDRATNVASRDLYEQYGGKPKVLDMFGGGGTIAYEAMRLGADAYTMDSNELAVFIQKALLQATQSLPDRYDAIQILQEAGSAVLTRLRISTGQLFPLREAQKTLLTSEIPIGYVWTYKKVCQDCGYEYYLMKRRKLSTKKGKRTSFVVVNGKGGQRLTIGSESNDGDLGTPSAKKTRGIKCPKCGALEERLNIKETIETCVGTIYSKNGHGKNFADVPDNAVPTTEILEKLESDILRELGVRLPESAMPKWSGITNPSLYGLESHADIFNLRQRVTLLLLIKEIAAEYQRVKETRGIQLADYVLYMLSALIDQLIDWNCRLSMWIPQNEQVGRAFCGPGVPMFWEYVETDPLQSGPSNLWSKLERIVSGASRIADYGGPPHILLAVAQDLPFEDDFFDAIITDPPYYDNIYYSVLADFFYVWKRLLFERVKPGELGPDQTSWRRELVASSFRHGAGGKAHEKYRAELEKSFVEAARVLKPEGVFSLVYSHSSLGGWSALINAFRQSAFHITGVEPLSIERKQRPRAMRSMAVNTCITFVARKSSDQKDKLDRERTIKQAREIIAGALGKKLQEAGWNDQDTAIAMFAQCVALLANGRHEHDGEEKDSELLISFDAMVRERYPTFRLQRRNSL